MRRELPSRMVSRVLLSVLFLLLAVTLIGCGAPAKQDDLAVSPKDSASVDEEALLMDPEALDPLAEQAALAMTTLAVPLDQEAADADGQFAGLDLLFPEIVVLDDMYRETLEAMWSGDLPAVETGVALLDSALAEENDSENALATVYYQNLSARVERLRSLLTEQRSFQSELARMDSLGVITAEGYIDSLALQAFMERPAGKHESDPRWDFELVTNPLTERWIRYFTGDGRRYMETWLERKPRYEATIYSILDEYNLPRDLIYLAMIESGLSMKARSYANAVGPWQFISSTGRLYGLKIDWWVDERRDLEKATRAAASHLSDLYESLGSWPLAFSAYNAGIRRVERAIRRHGTRDFWRLSSLPRQTRNYVPKFMAALEIGQNAERYGFTVPKVEALEFDVVEVTEATDLSLVAKSAGVEMNSIVELNPHLKRWATPPGETYSVKVPKGLGEQTKTKLDEIPASERVSWARHRVRRGENLSLIARKYGTSVTAIKQANKLRRNLIRAGSFLLIPVVGSNLSSAQIASISKVAESNEYGGGVYVVRRGDTLGKIAKRHGVTVRRLMQWNGKRNTRIHVGERLLLQDGESSQKRITYVVKRGDTLSKIGKRHRVSVREIMRWNKKRNTRIRIGERLRLYISG